MFLVTLYYSNKTAGQRWDPFDFRKNIYMGSIYPLRFQFSNGGCRFCGVQVPRRCRAGCRRVRAGHIRSGRGEFPKGSRGKGLGKRGRQTLVLAPLALPDISSLIVNGVQMGALCPVKDITVRPVATCCASQKVHKLPRSFPGNLPASNLVITKRYRADCCKIPTQWVSLRPLFF